MYVENFEQAVNDLKQGVIIHERFLSDTDRILAESYYKYALALEFNGKFDDAKDYLNKAMSVLRKRCSQLKEAGSELDEKTANEISDLESLFPEIEAKIEDLKLLEEQTIKDRQALLEKAENLLKQRSEPFDPSTVVEDQDLYGEGSAVVESVVESETTTESKGKAPMDVNDLSNLVRKKPKVEKEEEAKWKLYSNKLL